MSMKLRDLIRKVRACKTAAEERAVIAKESAMIRTAIREEQSHFRHRNVAKLLFMHMLGYPTQFGQLECMKLTASPHFPEKRIGYLGMLLLLSEEADVLMLATNALKNDLVSENKFVAGLALVAIGNLATADMSRDLAPEVDKHLKSPLPYLRKKACLAMARCLTKCPEMVEDFCDRIVSLLQDRSHGVLICVVQLMTQVMLIDTRNAQEEGVDVFATECRIAMGRLVPSLVKMLRNLLSSGYAPDHDVGGIADPFLQVQLLILLRLLGTNDAQASEEMNDVLAQVASNTETSKNAGNAILYECVQTIMGVESEDGLRVLAVNILGRFLLNRDNNIRYVALNTLARCIIEQKQSGREADFIDTTTSTTMLASSSVEMSETANSAMAALQRHRTTVVECLKDPDVSIRQRALELIYHLVNESNVETLTAELLNYLVLCPREHRADICTRILKVVDRYSPDDRWRVDTLITTLTIAGREASLEVQSATIVYISRAGDDMHSFATHKLSKAIRDDDGSQYGLLSVGIWCIGEYGDLLLQPYTYTCAPTGGVDVTGLGAVTDYTFAAMDPLAIVSTVESVAKKHGCPTSVQERALTAYVKLSHRLADKGDAQAIEKLQFLLNKDKTSRSLELQLRSCEYDALMKAARGLAVKAVVKKDDDDLFGLANTNGEGNHVSGGVMSAAKEALARMPVVDEKILRKRLAGDDFSLTSSDVSSRASSRNAAAASAAGGTKPSDDLLDLTDLFGAAPTAPELNGTSKSTDANAGKSDLDLLSDIFSAPASVDASAGFMPSTGSFDPFADIGPQASVAAPAVNPMDLFGAAPVHTAPVSSGRGIDDLFGAAASTQQSNGQAPQQQQQQTDLFAFDAPAPAAAPAGGDRVPGLNHAGLSVEFECTKPEQWNLQKSTLIAHFSNTTDAPINGLNLQVAVPKFITMQMEPPSATTVPAGSNGQHVTQKVHVTNSMLGTKNLVLKLKIGFTTKDSQRVEHMTTCAGFPAGKY